LKPRQAKKGSCGREYYEHKRTDHQELYLLEKKKKKKKKELLE